MKMNKMFYVTVTMVVMLFIATGCQKQDKAEYDNKYFLVSDDFINGYGSDVTNVYIQNDSGLYAVSDATDASAYEKYGIGFDLSSSYGVTGVYARLEKQKGKTKAFLSYGDIAPVVLDRKKDNLYSKENFESLSFHIVEFVGYKDYKTAMEEYGQIGDNITNIEDCRCYKVHDELITVYSSEEAPNGGTYYDVRSLAPGLYYVDDSCGLVEIR